MKAYIVVPNGISRSKHDVGSFIGEIQAASSEKEASKLAKQVFEETLVSYFGEDYSSDPKRFVRKNKSAYREFCDEFRVDVREIEIP